MTDNNADYELWAAMMADDEDSSPAPVAVEPVFEQPAVVEYTIPSIEIVTPVVPEAEEVYVTEPLIIPEPEPSVIDLHELFPTPEPVVEEIIEQPDVAVVEEFHGFSDLAQSVIEETVEFPNNLFKEPQTNQISLPEIPDVLNADIVTDSGEILKTGAIDIPILGTNTGSIPIITANQDTINEEAIVADMGEESTAGIPPIRAKTVMNSSAKVGVLPIKNRRSEGQTIILATTSLLLVSLGALILAAYMFEII